MTADQSGRVVPATSDVEQVRRQLDALGTKLQREGVTSSDLKELDVLYKTYLDARTTEPPVKGLSLLRRFLFGE